MPFNRRVEWVHEETPLMTHITNWSNYGASGGTVELSTTSPQIPTSWGGWSFGRGDLLICFETLFNSPSIGIPAYVAPTGGTGTWTLIGENTGTDNAARGFRQTMHWKMYENNDGGKNVYGMPLPALATGFRRTRLEAYYLNRSMRGVMALDLQTVAVLPPTVPPNKTLPLAAYASDLDYDLLMGFFGWQCMGTGAWTLDANYTVTPIIGTQYLNRDPTNSDTPAAFVGFDGLDTTNRFFKNFFVRGDPALVNMVVGAVAPTGSNVSCGLGAVLKIR